MRVNGTCRVSAATGGAMEPDAAVEPEAAAKSVAALPDTGAGAAGEQPERRGW